MIAFKLGRIALPGFLVLGALGLVGCSPPKVELHGTLLDPPKALPLEDFTLLDPNGQPQALSRLKGLWTLLFFGYTHCPDVCPLTLAKFRQVRQALGEDQARRVRFVFITVDPERDTPERLRSYVWGFHPEFLGLTGSPKALAPVYQAFGVVVQRATPHEHVRDPQSPEPVPHASGRKGHTGYEVIHTASIFLLNPKGELFGIYPQEIAPEDLLHDLEQLLR